MTALGFVLHQPWVAGLGWTLVHFLWQGTAIAAAYAIARAIGGRFLSARGRYARPAPRWRLWPRPRPSRSLPPGSRRRPRAGGPTPPRRGSKPCPGWRWVGPWAFWCSQRGCSAAAPDRASAAGGRGGTSSRVAARAR